MGNANPPHIILSVSYLNMLFTSIKAPVPNRKLYLDFLISSTAKNTNSLLRGNPVTPSR